MTRPLAMPENGWPAADRLMWDTLLRTGDLLDEPGALAHLRTSSRRELRAGYGRWLEWLCRTEPAALSEPPALRPTPERFAAWLAGDLARISPTSRANVLYAVLRIVSASAPDQDRTAEYRLWTQQRIAARDESGARKRGRVVSSSVLMEAGLRHAEAAGALNTPLRVAKARRDGVMLAFLALLPMRCRSVVSLELGRSVEVTPHGLRICLTGNMTKNGRPWEAPVPKTLLPYMERYLAEVRPWFLSRGGQAHASLWVDNRGAPYTAAHFSRRITGLTERLVGIRIPPHFFRDAAATTLARASPSDAALIRPLLGHASFGMAERHYNHATALEAGRGYADLVGQVLNG